MLAKDNLYCFFSFVFRPLFVNGRWLLWLLPFIPLVTIANAVNAIFMDIPTVDKVNRISGKFLDTAEGYSRTGLRSIGIVDPFGVIHKCNCEPLGYPNCLGKDSPGYMDVLDQLDAEILKNKPTNDAMIKWLSGRNGEVWMYPNKSFARPGNSCYKISDGTHVFLSFEQAVQNYTRAKTGGDVYYFFIAVSSVMFSLFYFIVVRAYMFLKGDKNG